MVTYRKIRSRPGGHKNFALFDVPIMRIYICRKNCYRSHSIRICPLTMESRSVSCSICFCAAHSRGEKRPRGRKRCSFHTGTHAVAPADDDECCPIATHILHIKEAPLPTNPSEEIAPFSEESRPRQPHQYASAGELIEPEVPTRADDFVYVRRFYILLPDAVHYYGGSEA